jgi:hypothetical protein
MKYSLARFFRAQPLPAPGVDDASGWGIFDPAFEVVHAADSIDSVSASPHNKQHGTAMLLPAPLLRLYHSALFSPVLLSAILTRQYVSHIAVGDVVHPCVFHTQRPLDDSGDEASCHKALGARIR